MQLSPHFSLAELTFTDHRGIDNSAPAEVIPNLQRVAELLEKVRLVCGMVPIIINSGYRCKKLNDAVGSKDSSQHRTGCAADFRIPGMTARQIVDIIRQFAYRIGFDQLICEYNRWVHISVPNTTTTPAREQVLTIDANGTRPYA